MCDGRKQTVARADAARTASGLLLPRGVPYGGDSVHNHDPARSA